LSWENNVDKFAPDFLLHMNLNSCPNYDSLYSCVLYTRSTSLIYIGIGRRCLMPFSKMTVIAWRTIFMFKDYDQIRK
jgi:hypothetical protein